MITYTTVSVWSSAQLQRLKNWFSASKVVQELRDKLRTSRDGQCSSPGRSVTHNDRKGTPTLKVSAHEHPYYTITHRQEYDIMMCVLAHMQHKHTYWRRKHRKRYQERPSYHALIVKQTMFWTQHKQKTSVPDQRIMSGCFFVSSSELLSAWQPLKSEDSQDQNHYVLQTAVIFTNRPEVLE